MLLQYLFTTYGRILPHALEENDKLFRKTWDPSVPCKVLIDQIKTAQEIAEDAMQPYTRAQVLSNALNIVQKTVVFGKDCKRWTAWPVQEHTWNNFKAHFLSAQEQFRLQQTAAHSGYFGFLLDKTIHDKCLPIIEAANSLVTASTAREDKLSTLLATHATYTTQHAC